MQFGEHYAEMKQIEKELLVDNPHIFQEESTKELSRKEGMEGVVPMMYKIQKYYRSKYDLTKLQDELYKYFALGTPIHVYSSSVTTAYGVQNLYMKTLEVLGTAQHQQYLDSVRQQEEIGCFALTELGHGSNVRGILTTAEFDANTDEFVLNTPGDLAMKFWIGGAGKRATMGAVWAQLMVDGKS